MTVEKYLVLVDFLIIIKHFNYPLIFYLVLIKVILIYLVYQQYSLTHLIL